MVNTFLPYMQNIPSLIPGGDTNPVSGVYKPV